MKNDMTVRNAIPHSTRVSTKPKRRTAKGAKPESPGIALFELGYILDNANHGMRIINKDFTIRFINQAFTELSGVNQKEAIGRKCWAILKGPFCHTPNCFLNRILNGEERVQVEIDRQRKDGTTIPCIVTAIPFNTINGEFTSIIETLQDITERKHLEEQISESEDRYRALIDLGTNIGEAIIMLQDIDGKEGVQTYISDQWSLITGYTKRELLGMSFFDLVSPKDREPSIKRHQQKISLKKLAL